MARLIAFSLLCAAMLGACNSKPQAFDVSGSDVYDPTAVSTPTTQTENQPTAEQPATQRAAEVVDQADAPARKDAAASPSLIATDLRGDVKNKFWSRRNIYFFDNVGGTGDLVYEAIKGQPYYTNTVVLVYATDEAMEGTGEYTRVEQTLESTRLDDRIFIWVHFDADRKVKFVRKLISDNIKGDMADANYRL
ncbi:MAG: hypothetical protein R3301_03865 [Saprospiraceae bacterium]|nr:hypothetical protein [Saprospiraceae bacterium]